MARIHLAQISHAYTPGDWVLRGVDLEWRDGGAYALLGPSGCGKSTLLNLISGLLRPTEGRVLFDAREVTALEPGARNIAQVFQFPVVYDTMSVYDNLAFPLRNRGVPESDVKRRVEEIAALLDLADTLPDRAARLTADGKQKISLGRGLVRSDVSAILFDEPLTVIDPHLKWRLRSKLKELHQRVGTTMIYVTHDQTEALTFADQVVVMDGGRVVQVGTPVELFERPRHTFVGHFIGSPGMNLLPCAWDGGAATFAGRRIEAAGRKAPPAGPLQLGVRPEFVRFADQGLPVQIERVDDAGRHRVVHTRCAGEVLRLVVGEHEPLPEGEAWVAFDPAHTQLYADGWIVE